MASLIPIPVPSTGISIGNTVTGAEDNSVLYVDSDSKLASNSGILGFTGTDLIITGKYHGDGSALTGVGVATDHGTLTGLADDDHTQYVLVDGSRSMTGTLTAPQVSSTGRIVATTSGIYGGDIISLGSFYGDGSHLSNLPTGVTDHGALTGLTDDDHTQYVLADGTRSMTKLVVTTSGVFTGDVRAQAFYGSGANLTNLPGGISVHNQLSGLSADDHTQYFLADGSRTATKIDVTNSGVFGGDVRSTGGVFRGDGSGLTNIDHTTLTNLNSTTYTHLTAAQATDLTDTGDTTLHKHDIYTLADGTRTMTKLDVTTSGVFGGDIRSNGGVFRGDGSGLTNLNSAIIDHGSLIGLTDDDHTQYARTDGTRTITGDQTFQQDIFVTGSGVVTGDVRTAGVFRGDGSGLSNLNEADIDHSLLTNLNSATYTHLTATNHTDLTDGGNTTLHVHDIYTLADGTRDMTKINVTTSGVFGGDVRIGGSLYIPPPPASGYVLSSIDTSGKAAWSLPVTGVTDHGLLTGLSDDDHTQYVLVDGTRAMTKLVVSTSGVFTGDLRSDANIYGDIVADSFKMAPATSGYALTANSQGVGSWTKIAGLGTVWIPASALKGTAVSGAGDTNQLPVTTATTTNGVNYDYMTFANGSNTGAFFELAFPKSWDNGTITFNTKWTALSGTGTTIWGLKGLSEPDGGQIDTAYGTEVTVTDTFLGSGQVHNSPISSAVTLAGTAQNGAVQFFQITRKGGTDTLAASARLIGLSVFYNKSYPTDD